MSEFVDLELSLHRREGTAYSVEARLSLPGDDSDKRLDGNVLVELDLSTLQEQIAFPKKYGELLTKALFDDTDVLPFWVDACARAGTLGKPLRVRLLIGPSAPELNAIYWETLLDPQDKSPITTNENFLFSRYLTSTDWRPVKLRPKRSLEALVAISNPSDLTGYKLAVVDVEGELSRAREALGQIPVTAIPEKDGELCTLDGIIERLRDGYDILYLVAHGTMGRGEPYIWLQDKQGKSERIPASAIVQRIRNLQDQPRLVVLASCQSAGDGNGDALQAFGPQLAQGGIPAVMAMQGSISMDTVKEFMPVFFSELQKDGQIDRALSAARGTVSDAPDFWMPVLFMRLKSGKIWYVPGFGEDGSDFKKWPALLNSLRSRGTQPAKCTPILGWGLVEPLLGSMRDIALSISDEFHFPLASFQRDALPPVAQYLAINQDPNTLLSELDEAIRKPIQSRYLSELPDDLKDEYADVQSLIAFGGKKLREEDPIEQHAVLASLPLPIYITTNFDNMMFDALKDAGKDPQMVICPWSDRFFAESIYDTDPNYRPTAERPLVYHLFGHFSDQASMVITEDDYFSFLIGVTGNKDLIPPVVRRALADTALLFIGFHLDDWSFRVFFRTVMGQQGGGLLNRYSHVGVQLDPDESRALDPRRARDYLENYFDEASIDIYWGRSYDFLRELSDQLKKAAGG